MRTDQGRRLVTIDELTPEERTRVQEAWLKRWLAVRYPQGTRRKTDAPHIVIKKYDSKGNRILAA